MDAKSEEEDSSNTSTDTEGRTKKSEREKKVVMKNAEVRVTLPCLEHPLPFRRVKTPSMGPKWGKVTKRTGLASKKGGL